MTHSTSHSANRKAQINLSLLSIVTSMSLLPWFLRAQLGVLVIWWRLFLVSANFQTELPHCWKNAGRQQVHAGLGNDKKGWWLGGKATFSACSGSA